MASKVDLSHKALPEHVWPISRKTMAQMLSKEED